MVRRLAGEIDAEAESVAAEMEALIAALDARKAAAQRLCDQTTTESNRALDAAHTALDDAQAARREAPTNVAAAEKKSRSARVAANNAATLAGQDTESQATSLKDEWKECRASIDRFDKILVDLRKTGIGFVTTIIGAAAFLLTHAASPLAAGAQPSLASAVPAVKVSVFIVIALLILGLYTIDRVHQIWLRGSVERALELEPLLGYRITQKLSDRFRKTQATIFGGLLYGVFLLIAAFIFVVALEPASTLTISWTLEQYVVVAIFAICILFMIIFTLMTE